MSRLITKEQTKKLVRGTPKKLDNLGYNKAFHLTLHYLGDNKFGWYDMGKIKSYSGKMWLPLTMQELYVYDKSGVNKRRNLGELDEYVYQLINQSELARRISKIKKLEREKLKYASMALKHLNIKLDEISGKYKLFVYYNVKEGGNSTIREEYKGLDGIGVEENFNQFVQDMHLRFHGVKSQSDSEAMVLEVEDLDVKIWEDFINVILKFDKYLQGKELWEL